MNKKFFIFGLTILIISAMVFVIISCSKDSFSNTTDEQLSMRDSRISKEQIYDIRKAFAKTLIIAMHDEPALRSFIKTKCIIADTSDYELVYLSLKDNIVTRGLTFSQLLANHAPEDVLRTFGGNFFNQLVNDVPLLTISFPDMENIHLSDWTTSIVPDVAAVSSINLKSFTLFSANNSTGNELTLSDGQMEEDLINRPVLFLFDAENHYLINYEGRTFEGIDVDSIMPRGGGDPPTSIHECWHYYLESQQAIESYILTQDGILQQYYLAEHNKLIQKYMECLNLFGVTVFTTDLENPCQRDHEILDEQLVDFKLANKNVYETIKNQAGEKKFVFHGDIILVFRSLDGVITTQTKKVVTPTYRFDDLLGNCTLSVLQNSIGGECFPIYLNQNYRIWTDWKMNNLGSPYNVVWSEVDNQTITNYVKFPFSSSFKVKDPITGLEDTYTAGIEVGYSKVGTNTVELGNQNVFYCDPIIMENNTGSIVFRCN